MSYVLTTPEMLAAAASDVGNIGSAISVASSSAAGPTTGLLPAAEDEVSAAIAKLFGAYGQEYQAVVSEAVTFHNEFTQALAAAGNAYLEAETVSSALLSGPSNALNTITAPIQRLFGQMAVTGGSGGVSVVTSMAKAASADPLIALTAGGTGSPIPDPGYVTSIFGSYIQPKPLVSAAMQDFFAPEQLWPITTSLGNLTFGQSVVHSQSATAATNEITALVAAGSPYQGQLPFTAAQVANPLTSVTSPDYTGSAQFYEFLTQDLPLLQPIRAIPFVNNPIADVSQPVP